MIFSFKKTAPTLYKNSDFRRGWERDCACGASSGGGGIESLHVIMTMVSQR